MANRKQGNFRLTPEVLKLILNYANTHGISQSAVVELAVRKFVKSERNAEKTD